MNNKGFLATSILYSFFFVFVMIMIANLSLNASRSRVERVLKADIRNQIESNSNFADIYLENKTYSVGEVITYAKENWRVVKNSSTSINVILDRSLNEAEIEQALKVDSSDEEFYGSCSGSNCMVRQCKFSSVGGGYCYYLNDSVHNEYYWNYNGSELTAGSSIVKTVVENWFANNSELQVALAKGRLNAVNFSDNGQIYPCYVRIPETTDISSLSVGSSFHTLSRNATKDNIYIYTGSTTETKITNEPSYVRPFISIKKD